MSAADRAETASEVNTENLYVLVVGNRKLTMTKRAAFGYITDSLVAGKRRLAADLLHQMDAANSRKTRRAR